MIGEVPFTLVVPLAGLTETTLTGAGGFCLWVATVLGFGLAADGWCAVPVTATTTTAPASTAAALAATVTIFQDARRRPAAMPLVGVPARDPPLAATGGMASISVAAGSAAA